MLMASQRRIKELEKEVAELKKGHPRGAPLSGAGGGIAQLKDIGLMGANIPEDLSLPPPQDPRLG